MRSIFQTPSSAKLKCQMRTRKIPSTVQSELHTIKTELKNGWGHNRTKHEIRTPLKSHIGQSEPSWKKKFLKRKNDSASSSVTSPSPYIVVQQHTTDPIQIDNIDTGLQSSGTTIKVQMSLRCWDTSARWFLEDGTRMDDSCYSNFDASKRFFSASETASLVVLLASSKMARPASTALSSPESIFFSCLRARGRMIL